MLGHTQTKALSSTQPQHRRRWLPTRISLSFSSFHSLWPQRLILPTCPPSAVCHPWRPASRIQASLTSASSLCSSLLEGVSTANASVVVAGMPNRCAPIHQILQRTDCAYFVVLSVCVGSGGDWKTCSIQHDPHCQYLAMLCNGLMEDKGEARKKETCFGG